MNDKQLAHDNQMLTNELIVINQDLSKTKAELKQKAEALKKCEKERIEIKKTLESKENALEKLRKERDELWTIVNTDKYRNFKSVEEEKTRFEQKFTQVQQKLDEVQAELQQETEMRAKSEEEVKQATFQAKRLEERELAQEKLLQSLEEKNLRQL